jgi:hypothetical protein
MQLSLAALERANEAHSVESFDNDSDDYIDAGFDMVLIDPLDPSQMIGCPMMSMKLYLDPVPISPSLEDEMLSQVNAEAVILYCWVCS